MWPEFKPGNFPDSILVLFAFFLGIVLLVAAAIWWTVIKVAKIKGDRVELVPFALFAFGLLCVVAACARFDQCPGPIPHQVGGRAVNLAARGFFYARGQRRAA